MALDDAPNSPEFLRRSYLRDAILMTHSPRSSKRRFAVAVVAIASAGAAFWHFAALTHGQAKKSKPAAAATEGPDLSADLDEAIRVVEGGQFQKFLELYAPVEILRQMRQQDVLQQASAMLAQQPQGKAQLLAVLQALKKQTPRYDKTKGLATFEFDPFASGFPESTVELDLPATGDLKLSGLGDDLPKVVTQATKLLEAGDVATFVEKLFPATELARLKQPEQMAALLQQFKDTPELQTSMLADFERMKATKAALTDKGQVAVFKLVAGKDLPERIVKMQKAGNHWRLFDDGSRVTTELARQSKLKPPGNVMSVQMELIGGNWRFVELPLFRPGG
jgi:hypothetical protein